MPRKRQVAKLRARALTWRDVGLRKQSFFVGWHPPTNEFDRSRSHWETWEEYLGEWSAVRVDGLVAWAAGRARRRDGLRRMVALSTGDNSEWFTQQLEDEESRELPFAEILYQRVVAGKALEDEEEEESVLCL